MTEGDEIFEVSVMSNHSMVVNIQVYTKSDPSIYTVERHDHVTIKPLEQKTFYLKEHFVNYSLSSIVEVGKKVQQSL